MAAPKFEQRMLQLKGIKLPSAAHIEVKPSTANRAHNVVNDLQGSINTTVDSDNYYYGIDCTEIIDDGMYTLDSKLDDIVVGVIRSFDVSDTHRGHKLSKAVVISILDRMEVISSKSIMVNYKYSQSQAGHYLRACKLVIQLCKQSKLNTEWSKLVINAE